MSRNGTTDSETAERARFGRLGLGTVALSVGLGMATEASAEVIRVEWQGGPVVLHAGESLDIDLNHDMRPDFLLNTVSNNYFGAIFQIFGHVTNDFRNQIDFSLHGYKGASIFPTIGPVDLNWGVTHTIFDSNDPSSSVRDHHSLIGLLFEIPGSTPHYGALDVEGHGTGPDASLTVFGGFYESNPNTPISSVPEPGSLTLLALGFAGIAAWKKRQLATN